ncbi:MAG: hypothetical protein PHD74_04420 [Candidatus Krumholzibacteria bacterium]|nr:hypothetical protein [Candidatus Krumholzibacteria bacterium]
MIEQKHRRFPLYGLAGMLIILAAELFLFAGNVWVGTYFTPLVWTGYIIFVDALVAARKGESPLSSRRRELVFLVPISIVTWYAFEGLNLVLKNWSYVNLPPTAAGRWLGYAWSYATISPAVFVTAELIESVVGERLRGRIPRAFGRKTETAFFFAGLSLIVIVLLFPSPWLAPLPWIGALLLFEGMNDRLGIGSFSRMFRAGDYALFVSLLISGAICGILWESWNFRALAKWNYNVPYLPGVRLFEMPVLGYLGFPPFALECYLMYRFIRYLTPCRLTADVLDRQWNVTPPGEAP